MPASGTRSGTDPASAPNVAGWASTAGGEVTLLEFIILEAYPATLAVCAFQPTQLATVRSSRPRRDATVPAVARFSACCQCAGRRGPRRDRRRASTILICCQPSARVAVWSFGIIIAVNQIGIAQTLVNTLLWAGWGAGLGARFGVWPRRARNCQQDRANWYLQGQEAAPKSPALRRRPARGERRIRSPQAAAEPRAWLRPRRHRRLLRSACTISKAQYSRSGLVP